jgi:putative tryptophan/tyrosine transport system substrate-binding protein
MTAFAVHSALRLAFRVAMVVAAACPPSPGRAAPPEASRVIAVIYPDIGEPYRAVFSRIIDGIDEQARQRVPRFAVGTSVNPQELSSELRRLDIRVAIVLGRNGLKAAAGLDRDIGIVAGGVLSLPESPARAFSVHSLAPDPALLFARLKGLLPATRRVSVVYDARQNAWLIRLAREAAKVHGLELVAHDVIDLRAALQRYQDILASADPKRDALWLPQDSTSIDDAAVLPLVLQESWDRRLAVFSSSVTHVKRGALFALYPNNAELGRRLGDAALAYLSNSTPTPGVTPLKAVLLAVNVRTASHLGIELAMHQPAFDLVFPER